MPREINETSLTAFERWITSRGRGEETAARYRANVRQCGTGKDLTSRLRHVELAPNTKWQILASLKAWARFTKDEDLKEILGDIRLPPAQRVAKKVPLSTGKWRELVAHVRTARMPDPHRVIIVIMALRGLRLGDVLRIKRDEIQDAIRTGSLSSLTKGNKRRVVSIVPIRDDLQLLVDLENWDRVRDLVGDSDKTERAIGNRIRRTLSRAAKKVGVTHCYPHQLRRTFATEYLASMKGDPQALIKLQTYMNWSDLSTAARYVDAVDNQELNDAADRMVEGM